MKISRQKNVFKEESLLIEILFGNTKINKKVFKKVDFNKLIFLASSHLMLPSLYHNLIVKKLDKMIPNDLLCYLKEIYKINSERNLKLIEEINEIVQVLTKNKIEYALLKGSANIVNKIYDELGERMVGDIDILVSKNNGLKTQNILKENGYENVNNQLIYEIDPKHLPRLSHKKKNFAVEIHTRMVRSKKLYNDLYNNTMETKTNLYGYYTLSKLNQFLHNIYNFQINDNGYKKLSYSFRTIYDHNKLIEKYKINEKWEINSNKYLDNYFMVLDYLNLNLGKIYISRYGKIDCLRLKLKSNFKIYYFFDEGLVFVFDYIRRRIKQIKELLTNKAFRNYSILKIKNFFVGDS